MPPAVGSEGVAPHLPRLRPGSSDIARGVRSRRRPASRFAPRAPRGRILGEGGDRGTRGFPVNHRQMLRATSHVRRISQKGERSGFVVAFFGRHRRRRRAPPGAGARDAPVRDLRCPPETRQEAQGDPPGAPGGPGPAAASEARGAWSASEKREVPAGAAEDARLCASRPSRPARSRTSRASRTWSRATGCSEATTQTPRPGVVAPPRSRTKETARAR